MLVLLTGPTGSGKTALALAASRQHSWGLVPTLTTRPPRPREPDTKRHVTKAEMQRLVADPTRFRIFDYDGHSYATPLEPCRRAARDQEVVAVIDWVHPHPEDLAFLGTELLAVVLLPSAGVLERRLHSAGRTDRLAHALREREAIVSICSTYKPPWTVWETDAPLQDLLERLGQQARMKR